MVEFYIIAALLVVFTLAMLLVPMRKNHLVSDVDQRAVNIAIAKEKLAELKDDHDSGTLSDDEYEQARLELELNLQEDVELESNSASSNSSGRLIMPLIAVGVPLIAGLLYMKLGSIDATDYKPGMATAAVAAGHATGTTPEGKMPPIEEALAMLEEKLKENPDNTEGWFMLARTEMAMKNYPKATEALRNLRRLTGDDPAVLVRMADSVAMQQGGSLDGEPAELLKAALEKEPNNIQGLWLMGMYEYQRQQGKAAMDYWAKLEPLLASEPESQKEIQGLIAKAAQLAGEPAPAFAKAEAASQPEIAKGPASIQVSVSVSPELKAKASAEDTVFIYARAVSGPPMPLAVSRHKMKELPITVTLDDSMAMMPAMKISAFPKVRLQARISKSGNAITQPGDLIADEKILDVGSDKKADLVIDHVKGG